MARSWPGQPHYQTSIDRVGLAIGAGGLIGGAIALILSVLSGQATPLGAMAALVLGTIMTALGITALAIVPWTLLHVNGRRGPVTAAMLGAAIGFMLFLGGQTWGFGLFAMPPMDARTLFFRWASAIATSVVIAALAAGIAVVMWRVAYRRVM
jgi:hypothetical protein